MAKAKNESKTKNPYGGLYREWTTALNKLNKVEREGWQTIGWALASYIYRDCSDPVREQSIPSLGRKLDGVRPYAMEQMREAGITIYVLGPKRNIESLSLNGEDADESLERDIRRGKQKILKIEGRHPDELTEQKRKELGWLPKPFVPEIEGQIDKI